MSYYAPVTSVGSRGSGRHPQAHGHEPLVRLRQVELASDANDEPSLVLPSCPDQVPASRGRDGSARRRVTTPASTTCAVSAGSPGGGGNRSRGLGRAGTARGKPLSTITDTSRADSHTVVGGCTCSGDSSGDGAIRGD